MTALDIFDEDLDDEVLQHVIQNEKLILENHTLNEISANTMAMKNKTAKAASHQSSRREVCADTNLLSELDLEEIFFDDNVSVNETKPDIQCTSPILKRKKKKLRNKRPMRFKENISEKCSKLARNNSGSNRGLGNNLEKENKKTMEKRLSTANTLDGISDKSFVNQCAQVQMKEKNICNEKETFTLPFKPVKLHVSRSKHSNMTQTDTNSKKGDSPIPKCVGFTTASNKPLKFSEKSWKKAQDLLAEKNAIIPHKTNKPEEIDVSMVSVPTKNVNSIERQLNIIPPSLNETDFHCRGFSTASNKPLKISAKAWKRAQELITDSNDVIDSEIVQSKKPNDESSKSTNRNSFTIADRSNCLSTNPKDLKCVGFSTASNKELKISDEAWKRAKDLLNNNNNVIDYEISQATEQNVELTSTKENLNNLHSTCSMNNLKDSKCTGFSTASDKSLKISAHAWKKAQDLITESNKLIDIEISQVNILNEKLIKDSQEFDLKKAANNIKCNDFSTTNGKSLAISEESWENDDDLITENNALISLEKSLNSKMPNLMEMEAQEFKSDKVIVEAIDKIKEGQDIKSSKNLGKKDVDIKSPVKGQSNRFLHLNNKKAKKRNSSYKPPRKSLPNSFNPNNEKLVKQVTVKENVKNNSHKMQLGMHHEAEIQITISDESMLQALALFEGV